MIGYRLNANVLGLRKKAICWLAAILSRINMSRLKSWQKTKKRQISAYWMKKQESAKRQRTKSVTHPADRGEWRSAQRKSFANFARNNESLWFSAGERLWVQVFMALAGTIFGGVYCLDLRRLDLGPSANNFVFVRPPIQTDL